MIGGKFLSLDIDSIDVGIQMTAWDDKKYTRKNQIDGTEIVLEIPFSFRLCSAVTKLEKGPEYFSPFKLQKCSFIQMPYIVFSRWKKKS